MWCEYNASFLPHIHRYSRLFHWIFLISMPQFTSKWVRLVDIGLTPEFLWMEANWHENGTRIGSRNCSRAILLLLQDLRGQRPELMEELLWDLQNPKHMRVQNRYWDINTNYMQIADDEIVRWKWSVSRDKKKDVFHSYKVYFVFVFS